MYDIDTWEGCLSFLQMSVALNLACIIVEENPIEKLFASVITQNERNIDDYRKEYDEKRDRCKKAFAKLPPKEDAYLKYNELSIQHMKIDDSLVNLGLRARLASPLCFSYACMLLGLYGVLGLLLIPIAEESNWALNTFIAFTGFVILTLFLFLCLEVEKSFVSKEEVGREESTKYLVREVYMILFCLMTAILLSSVHTTEVLFEKIQPYIYDVTVILPYLSFIVCFFWYSLNRFLDKKVKKQVQKDEEKFEKVYKEFKDLVESDD